MLAYLDIPRLGYQKIGTLEITVDDWWGLLVQVKHSLACVLQHTQPQAPGQFLGLGGIVYCTSDNFKQGTPGAELGDNACREGTHTPVN